MVEKKPKKDLLVPAKSVPIIKHIQLVAEKARASGLEEKFQNDVTLSAKKVAEFLDCTEIQAILFCIIFNLNFRSVTDISDISHYLDCSMIAVTSFLHDIDVLVEKKFLRCNKGDSKRRRRPPTTLNTYEFSVNKEVFESVIRNDEKYTAKAEKLIDTFDLLKSCSHIIKDNSLDEEEMTQEIISIVNENRHLAFIQAIEMFAFSPDAMLLYFAVCISFVGGEDDIDLPCILEHLFDYRDVMRIRREFLNNQHPLLTHDLVQLENNSFKSDRIVTLTEKSLGILFKEDKTFFINRKKESHNVIVAKNIPEKRLFFNGELQKQLNFLSNALSEPAFSQLRNRLKSNGSAGGIVILLHGASGSGKTEYVYQLAKSTNRDIIRINISDTKSKWFGESEKLIKKVFDDYKRRVETSKVIPLLVFNECDGIMTARKTLGSGSNSVSQTLNSIQNIVLQELEEINGIFVAVTNLAQNLDSAIARRCLFKVCFDIGCKESRQSIWLDKMVRNSQGQPILTEDELLKLSEIQLSGGQIDNVCKKIMMEHLLTGNHPVYSDVLGFCSEETGFLKEDNKKIGYLR